jgi:hypothetical protein
VLKSIEGGLHPHSKIKLTSCLAQVETALAQGNLFPVEQKIARYILENPGKVVRLAVTCRRNRGKPGDYRALLPDARLHRLPRF